MSEFSIALTVKVDKARHKALKYVGARDDRSTQSIVVEAIDRYLASEALVKPIDLGQLIQDFSPAETK